MNHIPNPPHASTASLDLALGTYRMSGDTAGRLVTSALAAGVRSIDTAHLYKNETSVFEAVRAFEASQDKTTPGL